MLGEPPRRVSRSVATSSEKRICESGVPSPGEGSVEMHLARLARAASVSAESPSSNERISKSASTSRRGARATDSRAAGAPRTRSVRAAGTWVEVELRRSRPRSRRRRPSRLSSWMRLSSATDSAARRSQCVSARATSPRAGQGDKTAPRPRRAAARHRRRRARGGRGAARRARPRGGGRGRWTGSKPEQPGQALQRVGRAEQRVHRSRIAVARPRATGPARSRRSPRMRSRISSASETNSLIGLAWPPSPDPPASRTSRYATPLRASSSARTSSSFRRRFRRSSSGDRRASRGTRRRRGCMPFAVEIALRPLRRHDRRVESIGTSGLLFTNETSSRPLMSGMLMSVRIRSNASRGSAASASKTATSSSTV